MSRKKKNRKQKSRPSPPQKLFDPGLAKLLGIATAAYILLAAIISSIFGGGLAALITTPLWGLSLFAIAKWDQARTPQDRLRLRQVLTLPRLNYWHLLIVVTAILLAESALTALLLFYLDSYHPETLASVPEDLSGFFVSVFSDSRIAVPLITAGFLSHLVGGVVAATLPNRKCPAPYRHAIIGSLLFTLVNTLSLVPILIWSDESDPLTEQEAGVLVLAFCSTFLFAILGVWISTNVRNGLKTSRGRIVILLISLLALTIAVTLGPRLFRKTFVECTNPPSTATLNFWPITFKTPAEVCHDYSPVDARLVTTENYSLSREEWERGLTAKAGDEIYVLIYINNGAADDAEESNPGLGIARNVELTTEVDANRTTEHYIHVKFGGDNTNTVTSQFKITTNANERLEVVGRSGEIRNYTGSELMAKNLDVGNRTLIVGDLPPKFEASVFVRFKLKVLE